MDSIDRLGWAAGMAFRTYGLTMGVRVNRPELLARLDAVVPPGGRVVEAGEVDRLYSLLAAAPEPSGRVRRYHLAYAGAQRIARTFDLDEALDRLEADVRLAVAAFAPRHVFVHAGVVAWRGRAILLPGRTFAGKSTLVEALVRAGATYYSDEYAVVDARGRVHPFAKPIARREAGRPLARKIPVEELGGSAGTAPIPVGTILFTRYREGARFRPRRLTPGQAMLALFDNTVAARRAAPRALAALRKVATDAPALRGRRGDATETARRLLDLVEET